jgi:acyl-CoA thioesterase I
MQNAMHRRLSSLSALLFALTVPISMARSQTKILCLGDSITEGFGGWASYRYPLWFDLVSNGLTINFVGPWTGYHICTGAPDTTGYYPRYLIDFDRDHAGYCGWRTDQIAAEITAVATAAQPDIVLIHLGTNDIGQLLAAGVNNADANLQLIIERLRTVRPNIIVLLAQVVPRVNHASSIYIAPLNAKIAAIAAQMTTATSPIYLVDQNSGFDVNSMMQFDGTHPNTAGEQRIADLWRATLLPILGGSAECPPLHTPTANSLVALYTFDDGSARDLSASTNRMCVGLGTPQVGPGGFEGGGLFLDGLSYMRADAPIHPSVHPALTIGAWVKANATAVGVTLLSQDNGGFDRTIAIDNRGGSTGWSAFAGPGGGLNGSGVLGSLPATPGIWQFVACVYNSASQNVRLYVDGQVIQSAGNPQSNAYSNLFLGKEPFCGGTSCTLNGAVDNVFVLSEALSNARLDEIRLGGFRRIPTCPLVLQQPECQEACIGGSASFAVEAAGSELNVPLTYRWRKDGVAIDTNANPSAATPVLQLSSVAAADQAGYDCVVLNACGSATSQRAHLSLCYPNCDCSLGNPLLTGNDFQCFLTRFVSGSAYANCDGSTVAPVLNANDFVCFISRYVVGCP